MSAFVVSWTLLVAFGRAASLCQPSAFGARSDGRNVARCGESRNKLKALELLRACFSHVSWNEMRQPRVGKPTIHGVWQDLSRAAWTEGSVREGRVGWRVACYIAAGDASRRVHVACRGAVRRVVRCRPSEDLRHQSASMPSKHARSMELWRRAGIGWGAAGILGHIESQGGGGTGGL